MRKCSFRQRQVVFFGHTFSSNGVQADPRKIETINNMQPPRNVSEMKSLLGMTQYVSRFIPNYASTTAPLRALTHQKVSWKWQTKHYHLYLYGAKFTVITDHKPLLGIFKSQKPTSARIANWKLRLMPYDSEILYKPGKDAENPAEFIR